VDDTLASARDASQQIDQASQKVNVTLVDALGTDRSGENGAENIRETLSNVNLATANLADDTEALKHEFFFRGFFKKRGFYSLDELTPAQYRTNAYFQNVHNHRSWLSAADTFTLNSKATEVLSPAGEQQIDQIVGGMKDQIVDQPLVVEGYSSQVSPSGQVLLSRSRSLLVASYMEKRYHLRSQDIGVMSLNATPPSASSKSSWDGVCIMVLAENK
jgi:phospholipid/cholesterol/gamma-HCH transport system substrate-binding protein